MNQGKKKTRYKSSLSEWKKGRPATRRVKHQTYRIMFLYFPKDNDLPTNAKTGQLMRSHDST